ncbi:DUF2127 domain-containing protein [Clostridium moutaii]
MYYSNSNKGNNIVHKSFEIGMLLKAINGILEITGGILLVFLNPNRLNDVVIPLVQHELLENPKDIIVNFAMNMVSNFSLSSQHFVIFYLMSHGIIKLFLIIMIWRKKMWSYPLTIVSLILFIFYQTYRYMIDYSIWLMLLTAFDIIMIILTFLEYKNRRNNVVYKRLTKE